MKISLIICTRNRAERLRKSLACLNEADAPDCPVEVVIVDSLSDDSTSTVIHEFSQNFKFPIKTVRTTRVGLGHARNRGIEISDGDILSFTDDDCEVDRGYFRALHRVFASGGISYGCGQILIADPSLDTRLASFRFDRRAEIPAGLPVMPFGVMQGANIFFSRKVFEACGVFNENMGAGTPFPCEDLEMGWQVSKRGFVGSLIPEVIVYHHHGLKKGSPEADAAVASYDRARGAYISSLLSQGSMQVWLLWAESFSPGGAPINPERYAQLGRELQGAGEYFQFLARQQK
jgi:glycosyltransferase involved in cell wall biosynthesis